MRVWHLSVSSFYLPDRRLFGLVLAMKAYYISIYTSELDIATYLNPKSTSIVGRLDLFKGNWTQKVPQ